MKFKPKYLNEVFCWFATIVPISIRHNSTQRNIFWDFEKVMFFQMFDKYFFAWSTSNIATSSWAGQVAYRDFESYASFQNPEDLTYSRKMGLSRNLGAVETIGTCNWAFAYARRKVIAGIKKVVRKDPEAEEIKAFWICGRIRNQAWLCEHISIYIY